MTYLAYGKLLNITEELLGTVLETNSPSDAPFMVTNTLVLESTKITISLTASLAVSGETLSKSSHGRKA